MNEDPGTLQSIWNLASTAILSVMGWLFVRNENLHKEASDDRKKIRDDLAEYKAYIAGAYAPRHETERRMERMVEVFREDLTQAKEEIKDLINAKLGDRR